MTARTGSIALFTALSAALLGAAPSVAEPPPEKDWTFLVAPYVWLPAMTGNARLRGIPIEVDTSIADIFDADFALALKVQTDSAFLNRSRLVIAFP